ncbi:MAG: hypothetical protein V1809_05800 [Planctomycetota bacterium]
MNAYRQGDVILIRVTARPKETKPLGHLVLAEGEVTGHAHRVAGDGSVLLETDGGRRFLDVREESILVHEEHGPVTLPPGFFEVKIQREYDPERDRIVRD